MIAITGAAGFIGSALVWGLNQQGDRDLIMVDHFGAREKWKNLLGARFRLFVDRDRFPEQLLEAPWARDLEAIVHLGACSSTTELDMDYLHDNNTEYSRLLCQWCLDSGVRYIYASSAATYGDGSQGFADSDTLTPILKPLNPYGFSKWVFDQWVIDEGLTDKVAGLRFFNVFGPNEYHKDTMASIIFRAFPQAAAEGKVRLFESHRPDYAHGEQLRDFVYIKDVVQVMLWLVKHREATGIINVGTGQARSFNDLANALMAALDKPPCIEYFPMPEGVRERYQYFTEADLSTLRDLGFQQPYTSLEAAVDDYVRRYLRPGFLRLAECEK
jgi:ADP-L-glycero-D-manno-heptose 6-epimerase